MRRGRIGSGWGSAGIDLGLLLVGAAILALVALLDWLGVSPP